MGRKRRPLDINGVIVDLDAPGLQFAKRIGGLAQYWVANPEARSRGYKPRTVRLHYDLSTPQGCSDLERRCVALTNEMLAWLGDSEGLGKPIYDGTIAALIRCYQTDAKSPYHGLRPNTQRGYDDWCRTLERAMGKRRIDRLGGQDLRDCFLALLEPAHPGGAPRVRLAQACVRSMMRILLIYGAELGLPGCIELVQILERMTFRYQVRRERSGRQCGRARLPCHTNMLRQSLPRVLRAGRVDIVLLRLEWRLSSSSPCDRST